MYIASLAWSLAQQSYWLGVVCYDAHADECFYYVVGLYSLKSVR